MGTSTRLHRAVGAVAAAAVLALTAACSDDDGSSAPSGDGDGDGDVTTTAGDDRPDGPAAALVALPADGVTFIGSPEPFEPDDGYVQEELAASGTATAYVLEGELTGDGRWTLSPGEEADYRTRIVVRRPESADDFSGTVIVEWLNVSGGVDADPEWTSLEEEIVREGHAWVGVSAQLIGIEGGDVAVSVSNVPGAEAAGRGLRAIDPDRYGDLAHPGDAFANDIYSQVGRAIRAGDALGDLAVETLLAGGESQSAFALVTYINGVHPDARVYDGFFVHSRGGAGFPVLAPDEGSADILRSIGGTPTTIRDDLDEPVFVVQAENDVVGILGSHVARQPDTDRFRTWEVAGTAHADLHLMGAGTAATIDCGAPINDGPMHVVVKAAFHHLVEWVRSGTEPPSADPLETTGEGGSIALARDEDGIVLGGVRTPPVDVPAVVLSGVVGPTPNAICILSGSTLPMPDDRLAERYESVEDYEAQYEAAVDAAVEAGFLLDADRGAIQGYARPELIPGA